MLIVNTLAGFASAAAATDDGRDPYFDNVVLLVQPTADNPAIADLSPVNHAVTANGTITLSDTAPWPDGRSVFFDGNGWLSCADSDAFHMPGDYVVEAIFLPTLVFTKAILTQDSVAGHMAFNIYSQHTDPRKILYTQYTDSGFNRLETPTGAVEGVWQHITAVKRGTTLSLYHNGTRVSETAVGAMQNGGGNLRIGATSDLAAYRFVGRIAGIRITKGSSRGYGGAALPVPTAPWPTAA